MNKYQIAKCRKSDLTFIRHNHSWINFALWLSRMIKNSYISWNNPLPPQLSLTPHKPSFRIKESRYFPVNSEKFLRTPFHRTLPGDSFCFPRKMLENNGRYWNKFSEITSGDRTPPPMWKKVKSSFLTSLLLQTSRCIYTKCHDVIILNDFFKNCSKKILSP